LVAGISAFRREPPTPENKSARIIRAWVDHRTFTWLVSHDVLDEYRDVLRRLKVRRATIGRVVNLLAEAAETVPTGPYRALSPDPGDEPFCACAEDGEADFIVTLNPKDFPRDRLSAKVIAPGDPLPGLQRSSRRRTRL
jgi:predicted nucleic acid-binding protein